MRRGRLEVSEGVLAALCMRYAYVHSLITFPDLACVPERLLRAGARVAMPGDVGALARAVDLAAVHPRPATSCKK